MAPTRPALPGRSSPASTLSLTAHKTGSMAPGVVATTLRISSSETQKPSLWRTFPQRKQGTALRIDCPAEPGGRAGSPPCRGPGTHRDPWPSRSQPPHQGSQDTWCPVPSGQVSPSLGHHLPDKCPRDSAEDASSCLSLLCSGRKSSNPPSKCSEPDLSPHLPAAAILSPLGTGTAHPSSTSPKVPSLLRISPQPCRGSDPPPPRAVCSEDPW